MEEEEHGASDGEEGELETDIATGRLERRRSGELGTGKDRESLGLSKPEPKAEEVES